jgi:hypothetical protein
VIKNSILKDSIVGENAVTGSIVTNSSSLYIGASSGFSGRLFDGKIDEVRIWNIARTETEIRDNMSFSIDGTELGLISYWQFNDGSGLSLSDGVSSNNGTLVNMDDTDWVDSTQIWVIPMFNVDGNNKMWNHDSWWRKNTRGGYGVDLNRNYPAGWNSCNGSSGSQSSQTYRGPSPASEPETQAMMNFIANKRPVFDISYHAYSELVIYPYGCGDRRTQTKEVVEKIGDHIADLLDYKPGTAWELLYNADGGDIDWMYEAYQVIPYVIELNSRSQGFHPKFKKWRNKTVERNRDGWQYLLDRVQLSGIRGQVFGTDKKPLSNFMVKVFKQTKNGEEQFQNYVGHKTGMFHIVANPGQYKIQIITNKKIVKESLISVSKTLTRLNINL